MIWKIVRKSVLGDVHLMPGFHKRGSQVQLLIRLYSLTSVLSTLEERKGNDCQLNNTLKLFVATFF